MRFGSTLVSQLLKQKGGLVVFVQPLPVNEILRPPHSWTRGELVGALRSLSIAFARHAIGPCVLKLTSWNTLHCDIVADAFPETPWVLCLRDPVEVGVSLVNQPPGWLTEFDPVVDPRIASASRAEFVARPYAGLPAGAWEEAAARNSKSPLGADTKFNHDSRTKQAAASSKLLRAVDTFARPQIQALEKRFAL